jgi:hypothetical protein
MVWGCHHEQGWGGRDNNIIVRVWSMMGWGNLLNLVLSNTTTCLFIMSMVQKPVRILCKEGGGVADGRAGGCQSMSVCVGVDVGHDQVTGR